MLPAFISTSGTIDGSAHVNVEWYCH